jgi:TPR repeat protein
VAKDETRAVAFYQRACDGGDARGCNNLGVMYMDGRGVAKDEVRAVTLFQGACDHDEAAGCSALGVAYMDGRGVKKDEARAVTLYQQGCDGGNADGCTGLGMMYADGRGVAKDEAHAVTLYQKGCDGGEAAGCSELAWLLVTAAQPGLRDANAALPLARKAVEMTDSRDADYLDTLAEALSANGLLAEALETERKAMKLEPDNQKWKDRVAFFEKAVK